MGSGFTFGQQAQPQSQSNGGFAFGSSQPAPATVNGTGLFGRITASEEPVQNNSMFGQSQQSQPAQPAFAGFGQAAPAAQTQSSSFTFGGQTSAPSKSQEPAFSFGQTKNNTAASSQGFGFTPAQTNNEQPKTASFSFGQPASQAQNPSFSFGQPASTSQNQGGNTAFGSSSTSAPFSFGQSQSAPPANNAFGGFSTAPAHETQPASSMFGNQASNVQQPAATTDTSTEAVQSNPFAGLFAQNKNASQKSPSTPAFGAGASGPQTQPTPNQSGGPSLFKQQAGLSFGQDPSDTSMNSASTLSAEPSEVQSDSTPIATQQPLSSNGLFSPATSTNKPPASANGVFGSASTTSTPAKSLFSFGKPPQTTSSEPPSSETPDASTHASKTPKVNGIFGAGSDSESTPKPKPSTKDLFAGGSRSNSQSAPDNPPASLFTPKASVTSMSQTPKPSLFGAASTRQEESAPKDAAAEDAEPVKRMVYTKAAPIIPSSLEAEQYREYDRNYRLHSLNVGLQNKLASLDPRSQDFDSVIRQYVASRESIGESLGLYVRNVAGMKRKGEHVEERDTNSLQNKRPRSDGAPQSSSTPTPSTALQAKQPTLPFPPANTESSPSKATSVLKGMIPANTFAFGSTPDTTGTPKTASRFGGFTPSTTSISETSFTGVTPSSAPAPNGHSLFGKSLGTSPPTASADAAVGSTTPIKSPPKKPAFEVPKFGGGTTNFMASFGTQAKASAVKLEKTLMEKRKAEDFDSDEDDEDEFNKQLEDENRAKRAKIDSIAKAGFTPSFGTTSATTGSTKAAFSFASAPAPPKEASRPNFGNVKTPSSAANRFAAFADSNDELSESAHDEDQDVQTNESGEEDNDGENGSSRESEEQEEEDDLPEDEIDPNDDDYKDDGESESDGEEFTDFQKEMARARRRDSRNKNAGKSLFDRIERGPTHPTEPPVNGTEEEGSEEPASPIFGSAKNSTFKPGIWGSNIGHATPEKPSFSPFTPPSPQSASTYKPASTFNFTAAPAAALTPTPGASIFAGGFIKGGPVPGEGMFGSRPGTPSNADNAVPASNLAKSVLASPAGTDNTWKQGDSISFGSTTNTAPSFKFTSASPSSAKEGSVPNPFGSLFGTTHSDSATSEPAKLGFNFGTPALKSSPAPGFLGAVSHLGGGSAASSVVSSRATSPGLTDNESVATNETEDTPDDPQTSLMDSRSGEENEACLWEGRSKALMFVNQESAEGTKMKPNDWNSMGVGVIRLLQNKDTKKTRLVFRVEPSASILINSHLVEGTEYESCPTAKNGALKGTLFYKGNLSRWVFKVKTPEMGNTLAKAIEDSRKA